LLIQLTTPAHAGNGSGGVGNIYIDDNLIARMPEGSVQSKDGRIFDTKTGEALLQATQIDKREIGRYGRRLSRSTLGKVEGYEYIPETQDRTHRNFWIACNPQSSSCLKLVPLSKNNPKAAGVIGSLTRRR
jgi:hypothetical protein